MFGTISDQINEKVILTCDDFNSRVTFTKVV